MKRLIGKRIYFLGIGGVSMSALAIMMQQQGFVVGGSDERQGQGTDILKARGIEVDFVPNENAIRVADVIVASSAIKSDDLHMLWAKRYAKDIWTRGQLLGWISNQYEKVIAVAGSHGKTTTTAMLYEILRVAGKNPTLHLGGYRVEDGLNFHIGDKEFFVTEACEYYDNFLNLHPYLSIVTNVEKEHMDYFHTFSNQKKSFQKFKRQSQNVIESFEGLQVKEVRHNQNGELMFSIYRSDDDLKEKFLNKSSFSSEYFDEKASLITQEKFGNKVLDLHLHICEDVNTQNCIYACLAAKKLGISDYFIKQGLESFQGVGTRFEKVKCAHFDTVICDYAHHPTELAKAIGAAKKIFKSKKLITIFQPHTFSRTKSLLPQFVGVFKDLPCPVFFKTYSAREKPEEGLSALQLTEILQKQNAQAKYFESFKDLSNFLLQFSKTETALLFLGAGDLPAILHKNQFIE